MSQSLNAQNPQTPAPPQGGAKYIGPQPQDAGTLNKVTQLRSAEFRKGREEGWSRLDDILRRMDKEGMGALSAEEVQQIPLLYRSTMSALSVARNIVLDRNLLIYLENLSMRAYLAVYGPRFGALSSIAGFLKRDFPRIVRGMRWHILLSFIMLVAGVIAGYALVSINMDYFSILVPESLAGGRGPESTAEDLRATIFSEWHGFTRMFVEFASFLFHHNTLVGFMSFGLGFALGVPTLLLMIYNGVVIGAFIALFSKHGMTIDFIAWLSIHGVTEILAIVLCGAAGLVLAEKILFPGQLPRLENLSRNGRRAASAVAGCVLLFFIAGILEGGFRQLINNTPGRFAFALVTAALWFYYFVFVGRDKNNGN